MTEVRPTRLIQSFFLELNTTAQKEVKLLYVERSCALSMNIPANSPLEKESPWLAANDIANYNYTSDGIVLYLSGTVPATLKCKALDSVVIEPFPSPTATLDSFSYHNPCEHTLLTTCSQSNNKHTLRVTVNFSPSNLDLRGLAISINRTRGITIFRNSPLKLNNLSDPLFSNATHSLYDGGVLIIQQEQSVTVVLQEIGVQISRNFGVENSVEILVLDDVSAVDVCGLCGTVNGRLLFSDRTTEAESLIDSAVIEEFANSWSVNPLELLLGQQPEECGKY